MPIAVSNPHRSALNQAALAWKGTPLTADGTFQEIARYTVPEGEAVAIGYGQQSGQDSAIGRIYALIKDSANAAVNGQVRIDLHDPQDRATITLFEARTEQLATDQADRRKQLPFPSGRDVATQNWSLVIKIAPDSAATPSQANSVLVLDVTRYDAHF
ncbi:MAG: hypothetical protein IRY83_14920 [Chloroflexi bacterium]|nr:hypothetical protein [Chloroflexota bacterium]